MDLKMILFPALIVLESLSPVLIVIFIVTVRNRKRANRGKCKFCKNVLSPNDVHVSVSNHVEVEVKQGSDGAYLRFYCNIYFSSHCPKCGRERTFHKAYTLHKTNRGYVNSSRYIRNSLVGKAKSILPKNFFKKQEIIIGNLDNLISNYEELIKDK